MASLFDGITDFGKSILDKAPAIITALNPGSTSASAAAQASANGVATPAKPFVMPTWVKPVAIGFGALVALLLVLRALGSSKK